MVDLNHRGTPRLYFVMESLRDKSQNIGRLPRGGEAPTLGFVMESLRDKNQNIARLPRVGEAPTRRGQTSRADPGSLEAASFAVLRARRSQLALPTYCRYADESAIA